MVNEQLISISYACILIHVSVNVLGNRHQHENECSFIPKPCPNDVENCGTFRSSELDHHLQVCPYFECEHKDKGTLSSDVNMDILYWLKIHSFSNVSVKSKYHRS